MCKDWALADGALDVGVEDGTEEGDVEEGWLVEAEGDEAVTVTVRVELAGGALLETPPQPASRLAAAIRSTAIRKGMPFRGNPTLLDSMRPTRGPALL
jgi:hypothetical protein